MNSQDELSSVAPLHRLAPKSLYIHIPFCESKCFYCDFNSYVANDDVKAKYTESLLKELTLIHEAYFLKGDRPRLDTLFFGGGTPTVLPLAQWEKVATFLHDRFSIDQATEWTVEANPGSVNDSVLGELKRFGVNRLSFGAQTFNETLLLAIGRLHSVRDIEKSVERAMQIGFRRISLDLMFGLPDQTLSDVRESVRRAVDFGLGHVSVYGLKVEEGTPFAKWQTSGHLHLPEEDAEAAMYEEVRLLLQDAGFLQYEISNFARAGEEARHNLTYWHNEPYLAAGAGAHGYVYGRRYENVKSLLRYQQMLADMERPLEDALVVTAKEAMEDSVILGLRLREGVNKKAFLLHHGILLHEAFGQVISSLKQRGMLVEDEERIVIPGKYFSVANEIMVHFLGNS